MAPSSQGDAQLSAVVASVFEHVVVRFGDGAGRWNRTDNVE